MNKQANFVVIGSGGAGMAAAVTAMQNGVKNIVVLEKSPFLGGNSRMAGGILFVADPADQNHGNPKVDDVFRETMNFHHYRLVDPKILRAFLNESYESVEFLRRLDIPYTDNGMMAKGKYPFGNFYAAIKRMAQLLLGAGNEILRNTGASRILKDAEGKVCGVEAVTSDGETIVIETPAVAITTGGFTGNSKLLHEYFPDEYDDLYYTDALPLDGDGIALAESAGAELSKHCTLVKENAYSCDSRLDAPNRTAHQGRSLWVNCYGERFHDESNTHSNDTTNALVRQPGMIGYALFDGAIFEDLRINPDPMPDFGHSADDGEEVPMLMAMLDPQESLEREFKARTGWVQKADSIEELAEKLGIEPATLRATVDEYNGFCQNKRDELFVKDPKYLIPLEKAPFYALRFRPILIDTQGPIIVNHHMEVLGENHKPIPGLYAAGVCTSGSQGNDYHLFGGCLGYSVTSGRILGRTVSKHHA